MTGRLVHLNGAPGVGKSTLAAAWAALRPGVLCLDIDRLRGFVSGWQDDHSGTGGLVRPLALAMISAHVGAGRDVVLPQMVANDAELDLFVAAAESVGGTYVGLLLTVPAAVLTARWRERDTADLTTLASNRVIAEQGGDEVVLDWAQRLDALARSRSDVTVVTLEGLDLDAALTRIRAQIA